MRSLIEWRLDEVEQVNARLESAAPTTSRAMAEISKHWDQIIIRSHAVIGGERVIYQEGPLAAMRHPDDLIACYGKALGAATVMFCGIGAQASNGYYHFEIPLYAEELYLVVLPSILTIVLGVFFWQTVLSKKFVAHGVVIGMVLIVPVLYKMGMENRLLLIGEQSPFYMGIYEGVMGREDVRRYIERSDCLLLLGACDG